MNIDFFTAHLKLNLFGVVQVSLSLTPLLCTVGLQQHLARTHDTPATSPLPLGYRGHQIWRRNAFAAWGYSKESLRAASPLVRLVEGEERGEAPDYPQDALPQNWGETELNRSVTCMVLKAMANDSRPLALCHDEFHGS
ncbi:uncharacterized protein TNCV_1843611 [Trichonephila clavipes]|nr:uncharacterized protein TNCV_1843611 [Trichonephila clavipes]